ncbi:hypothetical protein AArcSl_2543 [Halalkaliarchaeum desulfuricum]|uniref:Uncharacterized protein n=1 Tax=Halalkaliarchaeum desulfuricum TaxID=2055893 RepID=A0A343TM42_9EURY|nr:exodeoxyribonuclease VII small subunit [Halalkaliarchaeum desulfuricum]AUX10164.1 hypothetical protein AArcSl_2543 [Halalkaliarchaeum desulfuricum]
MLPRNGPDRHVPIVDDRLGQLIERLETEQLSLQQADRLHEEATELLEELEAELDVGDGRVTPLDTDE